MRKYRIKEQNGRFSIEIEIQKTTGILWYKKTINKWVAADIDGYQRCSSLKGYGVIRPFIPPAPIKTLEEAKEIIKGWQKKPIYYTVD